MSVKYRMEANDHLYNWNQTRRAFISGPMLLLKWEEKIMCRSQEFNTDQTFTSRCDKYAVTNMLGPFTHHVSMGIESCGFNFCTIS